MTATAKGGTRAFSQRYWRFLQKPLYQKSGSLYARCRKIFPSAPLPVHLPFGAWLIARSDYLGSMLTCDTFEPSERAFLQRFLQPGMTVLDIGAHHGLYTLLAARQVGAHGSVYSFEPSPRERKALRLNLWLNRCGNVTIEPFALGNVETSSDLYVVEGFNTGCNSLRPPNIPEQTSTIAVSVRTLDNWFAEEKPDHIDFIKVDVEGAELSVIEGATQLLSEQPRPVIMAEVEAIRTEPWGYPPIDIIRSLENLQFSWFKANEDGHLRAIDKSTETFAGNFVAIPQERRAAVLARIAQP